MENEGASLDLLERQEWLEPVEEGLQKAVSAVYESAGGAARPVKNFLHGTWLGHPLHPVMTDVPLGAWSATLVLDVLEANGNRGMARGADVALQVGLAGAAVAAISGLTDWQAIDGKARRVGVVHGLLNVTSVGLFTASLICRKRKDRPMGRVLAALGFVVSSAAAYLGGNLVYGMQIGVNHAEQSPPEKWTAVLDDSALDEGVPRRVDAGGCRVLLVKEGGRIRAIGEVCSHLGGPLAEGKIEGGVVECPWHGSRFALEDGRVIDGPATHPQPCFDTRVREGRIEVRAR